MQTACERLADLVNQPEPEWDLGRGALVIAQQEYPELDVDAYVAELDTMAQRLRRRLPSDSSRTHILAMLNHLMFTELGFSGNKDEYYDPRNSFLNQVIERRMGIPITLSILYLEIARRLGLPLKGMCFPGHFLVQWSTDKGVIVLDPFNRGVSLSEEELRQRLKGVSNARWAERAPLGVLLRPASKKDVLVRLARNLKGIYTDGGKLEKALGITNLILAIAPDSPRELRDRGMLYNRLECFRAALRDLERFMELEPDAEDVEPVQNLLVDLRRRARSLN